MCFAIKVMEESTSLRPPPPLPSPGLKLGFSKRSGRSCNARTVFDKDICEKARLPMLFCSYLYWYIPSNGIAGKYSNFICNHLRNCQTVYQSGSIHCTFLLAVHKGSHLFMSLSTLFIICFLNITILLVTRYNQGVISWWL